MSFETGDAKRYKEVIDVCLKKFIEKGLYETTSRDLSAALKLKASGVYYYFKSKDEVVLACAEEASIRLEEGLLLPALQMIDNKDPMDEQSVEVVTEMRAMTRFLAQVCTANKYREQMQPALSRLREREAVYCEKFAQKLGCTSEELAPWFFAVVASLESYMIFGSEAFSVNPMDFTKKAMEYIKIIHNGNLSANSENKTGKFR